jgi:5'(3')-deoxyribonucleotidase
MNKAATNQKTPVKGKEFVIDKVMRDLQSRSEMGEKKYGTKLQTFNGRSALWDAYQEVLDLAMYLRQEILERKRVSIAFDLDDVILDTAPAIIKEIKKLGGFTGSFNDVKTYDLHEITSLNGEYVDKAIHKVLSLELPLVSGDIPEIFNILSKEYDIYIISHRKEIYKKHIVNNLSKHNITNYELILTEDCIPGTKIPNKLPPLIENEINFFIDDRPDTLEYIKSNSDVTTIMFGRPWNREYYFCDFTIFELNELLDIIPECEKERT